MKNVKRWLVLALALTMVLAFVAGCGAKEPAAVEEPAEEAAEEAVAEEAVEEAGEEVVEEAGEEASAGVDYSSVKIGVLASETKEDGGWTQAHYVSLMAMKENLGLSDDQVIWVESVPYTGSDADNIIDQLVDEGCNMILVTSSGNYDHAIAGAERHPDVAFGFKNGPITDNLASFDIRDYQSIFLTGYVAAKMSTIDNLGYVAANPEASVVRAIDSFMLGAQYANPNATMDLVWVNSWYDPPKEKEAANSLIAKGIEVLGMQGSSPSVQQAAEEAGIYSTGFHTDMRMHGPNANLTSFMWNWEPIYSEMVTLLAKGEWVGKGYFWGIDKGCASIAPLNEDIIPADIIAEVEALQAQIIAGEVQVFVGPLSDNEGTELLAEGETFDDAKLLDLGFLVEGVNGQLERAE